MTDSDDSDSQQIPFVEFYQSYSSLEDIEDSSDTNESFSHDEATNSSSDDQDTDSSSDDQDNESSSDDQDNENSATNEKSASSSDEENGENSTSTEETASSSEEEDITSASDTDLENSSDLESDSLITDWSCHCPKRNLKPFADVSNVMPGNYSRFRPLDAFKLLFTEKLFELLWKQTNLYGKQRYGKEWIQVSLNEIKTWIGLNILMGYHKLPSYKLYWSSSSNFKVPIVCNAMPRNLFTKILTNIHLADNKKMPSRTSGDYSKTYKVDQFLAILKENFQKNYALGEYISIDESMVKFKGRSSMKQYLPMKPTKRGFKVWVMADATNGYVYNFRVYTGKDPTRTTSLGEHVVKDMVKDIEFTYRQVYFDNYFSTPNLLEYLYRKGIYAAGTVRLNRKNMPKEFCRSTKEMNRGDFEFVTSRNVVLHKWIDKQPVFVLSNFHDPTAYSDIVRKEKNGATYVVKCPTAIIDYNRYMGGVDSADQRKSVYSLDRKSRRWWIRIFFNFLNVALSNAFVIFKKCTSSEISYLDFLSSITTELIGANANQQLTTSGNIPVKKKNRSSTRKISIKPVKHGGSHLPVAGPRGRCALCSTKKAVHRSIYHCVCCERAFCMNAKRNCFYDYHKHIS